jgi:hypothetical protein
VRCVAFCCCCADVHAYGLGRIQYRPDPNSGSKSTLPGYFAGSMDVNGRLCGFCSIFDESGVEVRRGHYGVSGMKRFGWYRLEDGTEYVGDWCSLVKPHGLGKMTLSDCHVWIGQFQSGKRHGMGIEIDSERNIIEFGFWIKGLPQSGIVESLAVPINFERDRGCLPESAAGL